MKFLRLVKMHIKMYDKKTFIFTLRLLLLSSLMGVWSGHVCWDLAWPCPGNKMLTGRGEVNFLADPFV